MAKIKKDQIDNVDISQVNNLQTNLDSKQDILAEWEFVDWDKTKLDGIEAGAEVNTINSWDNVSVLTNDANYITSDPTGVTGADQVTNLMSLTQAEYDAITPNSSTTYLITDA